MLILPAIDLRAGQCVRLRQGDYAQETAYGDPVLMARRWVDEGAEYLHLVDLDGAREGKPVNGDAIRAIVRHAGIPCQLGGGIRTEADLRQALDWGVDRVILGTQVLLDPQGCEYLCRRFPGQVAVGIDARNGRVATQGWLHDSQTLAVDLAQQADRWSVAALIYTDIHRDGMLSGPNIEATAALVRAVRVPVFASGGVTSLEDIVRLAQAGIPGCIVGRALYEGQLSLRKALSAVAEVMSAQVRPTPACSNPPRVFNNPFGSISTVLDDQYRVRPSVTSSRSPSENDLADRTDGPPGI